MINRDFYIGFGISLVSTLVVGFLGIVFLSGKSIKETILDGHQDGTLGDYIAIGILANFFVFFGVLMKNNDDQLRGVMIASIAASVVMAIYKWAI